MEECIYVDLGGAVSVLNSKAKSRKPSPANEYCMEAGKGKGSSRSLTLHLCLFQSLEMPFKLTKLWFLLVDFTFPPLLQR